MFKYCGSVNDGETVQDSGAGSCHDCTWVTGASVSPPASTDQLKRLLGCRQPHARRPAPPLQSFRLAAASVSIAPSRDDVFCTAFCVGARQTMTMLKLGTTSGLPPVRMVLTAHCAAHSHWHNRAELEQALLYSSHATVSCCCCRHHGRVLPPRCHHGHHLRRSPPPRRQEQVRSQYRRGAEHSHRYVWLQTTPILG